ncbi:DUF4328 domain-containing protein [Kitasatospora camelliae]|uniref:DUF4328 domain-containing protein n=1 Tax=Kitasatospora camelliae TaxID=3156397 RepID=A0AAU8JS18_9ACTN
MLCSTCGVTPAASPDARCPACQGPGAAATTTAAAAAWAVRAPFSDVGGIGTVLVILFALCGVLDLLSVAADLNVRSVIQDLVANAPVSAAEIDDADGTQAAVGGLQTLMYLATGVTFLVWFRRARLNAGLLDPEEQRRGPGWAVGGWFVPVVHLWFPRQIAGDIWRASRPRTAAGWAEQVPLTVVNLWWGAWLVGTAGGQLAARLDLRAETPDELLDVAGYLAFADLAAAVSAVLAVLFVRRLTAMQTDRIRTLTAVPYPVGLPV